MLSYAKSYCRNCRLARMSNGEVCLIRDQGLVKGGRGLKHHEVLIVFSIRWLAARSRQSLKTAGIRARDFLVRDKYIAQWSCKSLGMSGSVDGHKQPGLLLGLRKFCVSKHVGCTMKDLGCVVLEDEEV